MKQPSLKKHLCSLVCISLILIVGGCSSLSKTSRKIKHQYPLTWEAINQLALRQASATPEERQKFTEEQYQAFRFLSDKWLQDKPHHRELIKMGLYRWGWLPGDSFPDCSEVVDYQMVYLEFLQKTKAKTP